MSGEVAYSLADGVATITMRRPARLNAFTPPMLRALKDALDRAEADAGARVVALTGEGRFFSSGQDLAELDTSEADSLSRTLREDYAPLVRRLIGFSKVTIAALNGPAVGAGASIAMACDMMVAARSAYVQQAFVRIGLIPDAGATWLLPRIIGARRALALALTGEPVPAEAAMAMGLVHRVFDDADFEEGLRELAQSLARGSASAQGLIKAAFRKSDAHDLEDQLALEADLQGEAGRSADFAEALAAFRARRPPAFGKTAS